MSESHENLLNPSPYEMLQPVDVVACFTGFHVRSPPRKRMFHHNHVGHRAYVHNVPWECMANGMWFEASPNLPVAPGDTAPWLPPEEAAQQVQQRNGKRRPRGGQLGWLGQQKACARFRTTKLNAEQKLENSEVRNERHTSKPQETTEVEVDVDSHSVGSLCRHHASATFSVVAGKTHLPDTQARLGQLRSADSRTLYHSLGGTEAARWFPPE